MIIHKQLRRSSLVLLAAATTALLGAHAAVADAADDGCARGLSECDVGYEPGHADGWFDPNGGQSTFETAEIRVEPAPTPPTHGYEPGRPDGWYVPDSGRVENAGDVTSSNNLVPPNVR